MTPIRKKEGFEGQRAIVIPKEVIDQQCLSNPVIRHAFITDIGYYPRALHHFRQRAHGTDQNILIYCTEGEGWLQIRGVKQQISAGHFFILPPDLAHAYASDQENPWTIYWMHVKGKIADDICASVMLENRGSRGTVKYSDKRIALFEEVYSALERGYSSDQVTYANMCLTHFLASFQFDAMFDLKQETQKKDPIGMAIDFMQANIGKPLSLAEIASSVNLSASHFVARFHKKTGFSPVAYFNHLKIQKACQYLQFTDELIKEISDTLGIDDHYYFSRLFKKLMGISPLQYRKRLRPQK